MGIRKINLIKNISKLLIFALLVFSAQLFILNPKSAKAAAVSESDGIVTIHKDQVGGVGEDPNPSNFVIDPYGRVWGNEDGSTIIYSNEPNINVTDKDLIIDGSSIIVTFSGNQINLNSLTVTNGATVTHAGPGEDGNHYNNQDFLVDYAAVYEGWFFSTQAISDLRFAYDNWADLYWTEEDLFDIINPTPYYHGGTNTTNPNNEYSIGQVNANTWYHFKVLYKDSVSNSNSHTYFYSAGAGDPVINDSNFFIEKDGASGVIGRYYKEGTAFQYITFRNSNLLFMNVDPGLTEAHFPDTSESRNPTLSYDRELKLKVAGDVVLESGGKIDVSGKGYSGGSAKRIPNNVGCPPFAGGGVEITTTDESIYAMSGKGPGGGPAFYHCTTHNDNSVAGGGGYGGNGGVGRTNPHVPPKSIPGGISYPNSYNGDFTDDFEMGSGGGGATQHDAGYASFGRGGAGGGRVFIETNNISFADANSYIAADGEQGAGMRDLNGTAHGGGGAGGTIWIKVPDSSSFNGNFLPEVKGGGGACPSCAEDGTINGNEGLNINAKANGSHSGIAEWCDGWPFNQCHTSSYPQGGGGGGRIVIGFPGGEVPGAPEVRKVRVEVWWKELGQDQHVEFETWLRDVR